MKTLRKVLLGTIFAALLVNIAAWWALLGNICSSPHAVQEATQNTVTYNCHGSIVFITPRQQFQLRWSVPVGFLLILALQVLKKWQPEA